MTYLSEETVGRYFVDRDGVIWQHIMYCAGPTATLQQVDSAYKGERRGGAIGSPILDGFALLEPRKAPA